MFENQFKKINFNNDTSMLDLIPSLITREENEQMSVLPSEEKVKVAMFQLDGSSAAGPYGVYRPIISGLLGCGFKECHQYGSSLLLCQSLPRYVTHTNLVLIPKKEEIKTFLNLRPISLSYFINKVISRV